MRSSISQSPGDFSASIACTFVRRLPNLNPLSARRVCRNSPEEISRKPLASGLHALRLMMRMQPSLGLRRQPRFNRQPKRSRRDRTVGRLGHLRPRRARRSRARHHHAEDRRRRIRRVGRPLRLRQVDHPAAGRGPGAALDRRRHSRRPRSRGESPADRHGVPESDHAAVADDRAEHHAAARRSSSPIARNSQSSSARCFATRPMRCSNRSA